MHYLIFSYLVWGLRNKGLTKLKKWVSSDRFCYFQPPSMTSNSSLSFKARDLKVWIQLASSLAKKRHNFTWELRNKGFTKLTTRLDWRDYVIFYLHLWPQISQAADKISKNWSVQFVPLIWEIFLLIFSFLAFKLWEEIEVTDIKTDLFYPLKPYWKNLNSPLTLLTSLGKDKCKN